MSHINQSSPAQRQRSHQHSSMKRSISQIHSRFWNLPRSTAVQARLFREPVSPPISAPVTFNGQSYNHLPADIVSGIRQLQPFPILTSRQHTALLVIGFHFFPLLYYAKCHLIQIPPPPPPAVASGSAFGSSSVVPSLLV